MNNPNPYEFSFDTFPGLDAELDAAYAHNAPSEFDGQLAAVTKAGVAEAQANTPDTAANRSPDRDREALMGLSAEFQKITDEAHRTTEWLLDRIGLLPPAPAEFARAGFDFVKLQSAHEQYIWHGYEPQLVFAPVLELDTWKNLFRNLQDDSTVNADGRIKNGGLYIDNTVASNWVGLQDSHHTIEIYGTHWQLAVVPGTIQRPINGLDHNGKVVVGAVRKRLEIAPGLIDQYTKVAIPASEQTMGNLHPTIASYLSAQAVRLQNGTDLMDVGGWTWLDGQFTSGTLRAPVGSWSSDSGGVRLSWPGADNRDVHLGVRLPVWGR